MLLNRKGFSILEVSISILILTVIIMFTTNFIFFVINVSNIFYLKKDLTDNGILILDFFNNEIESYSNFELYLDKHSNLEKIYTFKDENLLYSSANILEHNNDINSNKYKKVFFGGQNELAFNIDFININYENDLIYLKIQTLTYDTSNDKYNINTPVAFNKIINVTGKNIKIIN